MAILLNNHSKVKKCLEKGADENTSDEYRTSVLHSACRYSSVLIIQELLKA